MPIKAIGLVIAILVVAGCVGTRQQEAVEVTQSALACGANALPRISATASSVQSAGNGPDPTLVAAKAIDGNLSTRWSSAWSDPQWIYVDMGATEYLSEVILRWEFAASSHYDIQVSSDASTWTTIYTRTNGTGGTETISGLSAVARYVRMYSYQRQYPQYGNSLYELEVYGDTNPHCGTDGGVSDSGADATLDASDAAVIDAADATVEASTDSGIDAGPDAGSDAADAVADVAVDAWLDAGADASTGDGGTCANVAPVGAWQQVWLPQSFLADQKLETSAVAVDPLDEAVYVAAGSYTNGGNSGTGVYRSNDCGVTFQLVSSGTGGAAIAAGDPWAFVSPSPGTLLATMGYGSPSGLFESTDHGVSWAQLSISPWTTPMNSQAIAVSPSGNTWGLSYHQDCSSPYNALCLGVSSDQGATWTEVNGTSTTGTGATGWQEAASLTLVDDSTLFYLAPWTAVISYDHGTTWTNAVFEDSTGYVYNQNVGNESYGGSTHVVAGVMYIGTQNGIFSSSGSTMGLDWTLLPNSPVADVLADDGVYLYASDTWFGNGQYGNGDGQVFYRAPLSNLSSWTQMTMPNSPRGSYAFAYDSAHHVLYSANMSGGLWRLVTQ